jgi:hypothetical protein
VADVAVGPGGQVLLTYQTPGDEGPSTIYVRLDPDGLGPRPFGAAVAVTGTNVGDFDHVPPQSQRTIDAEADLAYDLGGGPFGGRVYLGYTDETPDESGNTDVFVRYSDDDGATWSAAARLNDDATTNAQILPRIAVDPATGALAATWHDARFDTGTGGAAGPAPVTPGIGGTDAFVNNETQFYGVVALPAATGLAVAPNFEINGGFSRAAGSNNPNDYGDYTGLDFRGGVLRPAWGDNSNATGDNPDGFHSGFDLYTAMVSVTVDDPAPPPARRLVGQVGAVGRKSIRVTDADGTVATFSLRGAGSARLFQSADRIDVQLSGTTARSSLRVAARGGADGRIALGDVTAAAGPMAAVDAPAADLVGTLSVAGPLSRLTLANVAGGTVAAGGALGRVTVNTLAGAHVLSGALPATPTRAAAFGPGSIAKLRVRGTVAGSVIGAGLDPVNGQFLDADDRVIGGASSVIRSVLVKGGVDEASRFVAGAFKTARLPKRVDPGGDARFVVKA